MAKSCGLLLIASLLIAVTGCWNFTNPADPNSPAFEGDETDRYDYKITDMYVTASSDEIARNATIVCRAFIVTDTGETVEISDTGEWYVSDPEIFEPDGNGGAPGSFHACGCGSASIGIRFQEDSSDDFGKSLTVNVLDYEVLYVAAFGSDENGDGAADNPYRSIQKAVEAGSAPLKVYIAEGAYPVDGVDHPIPLYDGVSLLGGFNPDTWERDPSVYITTISDTSDSGGTAADPSAPVRAGGTISSSLIDGCVLSGSIGAEFSAGLSCLDGADLRLTNSVINGGSGGTDSYGIFVSNASPQIINNCIDGGSGSGKSVGIAVVNGAAPEIYSNTISGGDGGSSTGVSNASSCGTLVNNIIFTVSGTTQAGILESTPSWSEVGDNYIFAAGGDTGTNYNLSNGNVSHTSAVDPAFMSSTDWRPTAGSPPAIIGGGRPLSVTGYPADGDGNPVDGDGAVRGTTWSRGAYDRDSGTYITYSIASEDGDIQSGGAINQGSSAIRIGDAATTEGIRGYFSFDISPLLYIPSMIIYSADFSLYKLSDTNSPTSLGSSIYVDHVTNISYGADLIEVNFFNFPSGLAPATWQTISVATQVENDLNADRDWSRYRFYFAGSNMDGTADYENWAPGEDPNAPELVIEYSVP